MSRIKASSHLRLHETHDLARYAFTLSSMCCCCCYYIHFSTICCISMSRLCFERDVRLSVSLVDCDHIVQQKVEKGHLPLCCREKTLLLSLQVHFSGGMPWSWDHLALVSWVKRWECNSGLLPTVFFNAGAVGKLWVIAIFVRHMRTAAFGHCLKCLDLGLE